MVVLGPARASTTTSLPLALAGPVMYGFDPTGPSVPFGPTVDPQDVALGDFNGDGRQDLVVPLTYRSGRGGVAVLLSRGHGLFGARRDYKSKLVPDQAAVADVNGDAKPDVVVTKPDANVVTVLTNVGRRRFAARSYRTGKDPVDVELADLNGDLRPEVVIPDGGSKSVTVLVNDGRGRLGPRRDYRTGHDVFDVAAGDVDSDGDADLAVAGAKRSLSVLLNNGDATFADRRDTAMQYGAWVRVAAGDLNADGKADVVMSDNGDVSYDGPNRAVIAVLLATGDGRFATPRRIHAGDYPQKIALADLNRDRSLDLVLTDSAPGSGVPRVSVLANSGDGTFGPPRQYAIVGYGEREQFAAGDFTGDGWIDVATADVDSDTLALYPNSTGRCGVPSSDLQYELRGFSMRRALARNGCRVGRIRHVYSELSRGAVVDTIPAGGAVLPLHHKVTLVLSRGRRPRRKR